MNDHQFSKTYAELYDVVYRDKDYEAECDMIEEVFRRYVEKPVKSILDLGSGTGNHAIPLAKRGYKVTGVDRSVEMLTKAENKVQGEFKSETIYKPTFVHSDVRTIHLKQTFDAVLMMFAVLGYQTTNQDVLAALCAARRHLDPGRIFICDIWYAPAVLNIGPSDRVKVVKLEDGQLIRSVSGTLYTRRHLCKVVYHIWRLNKNRIISETKEEHTMRYFFPMELENYLEQSNLTLNGIHPFPNLDEEVNKQTCNILVCAQAK